MKSSSTPVRPGWTVALVCLASVLMTLDITIVNVALPEIAADLRVRLDGLQWVVNGYPLAFAALLLTAGSLSDRVGRRAIFGAGVALFTLASAACGLAPGAGWLAFFRVLQGVGGALVMATALALIAGVHPPGRARQSAIGMFSAAGGAAAGLGPLLGGVVVDLLGWRWIFWINIPVGAVLLAGTLWRLREPRTSAGERRGLDPAGAVLATGMLFGLNYGLLTGASHGWSDPDVVAALAAGAVLFALFLLVQVRNRDAMLDLRLFRIPSFSGAILLTFCARLTSFGILPFLILWLQGMLGHTPMETGVRLLAVTLPILIVAPLAGKLQQHVSAGRLMAAGFVLVAIAFFTLTRIGPDSGWTAALPGFILIGVGGALAFPPLMGVAIGVVPADRAGMASGLSNTFFPLGTAAGVAVFGALFAARAEAGLSDARLRELGVPPGTADTVRTAVTSGRFDLLAALPPSTREPVLDLARTSFTAGLTRICLAAALAGLVGAIAALALVRTRDLRGPEDTADPEPRIGATR